MNILNITNDCRDLGLEQLYTKVQQIEQQVHFYQ